LCSVLLSCLAPSVSGFGLGSTLLGTTVWMGTSCWLLVLRFRLLLSLSLLLFVCCLVIGGKLCRAIDLGFVFCIAGIPYCWSSVLLVSGFLVLRVSVGIWLLGFCFAGILLLYGLSMGLILVLARRSLPLLLVTELVLVGSYWVLDVVIGSWLWVRCEVWLGLAGFTWLVCYSWFCLPLCFFYYGLTGGYGVLVLP